MVEPQNISRDCFPKSPSSSEGMIMLQVKCDNNEMFHIRDIKYIERDGQPLYIQLIMPDKAEKKPPLIVYVQGSAFHKQDIPMSLPRLSLLANRGFAIASVEYRPSETAPFPAQMLDVKAAVRFMKMQAGKYDYDAEQVYLMGDSSGGHTSLMAGLTVGIEEYEEPLYDNVSSHVKGIIDMYGPIDFTKMNDELSSQDHMEPDSPEGYVIGRKNVIENPELVYPTVVTNYITSEREIPPLLIFHGTNDELVPFGQSCLLYDKLKACGKKADFYAIEGAHHGGREFWSDRILGLVEEFINESGS